MKPEWYGDKRDLVKWSVLFRLAEGNGYKNILQVAYYHSDTDKAWWKKEMPVEVRKHFRDLHNITNMTDRFQIAVIDNDFCDRKVYKKLVLDKLKEYDGKEIIVFFDPDTGLEPPKTKVSFNHVTNDEASEIWDALKPNQMLVLYQHKTSRADKAGAWKLDKKKQLERAIKSQVELAEMPDIDKEVVFYWAIK